ncbi:MAG: hypothetical protein WCS97_03015 [Candidatus Paceibacterota bacterium]|jgi:hypothetical protein
MGERERPKNVQDAIARDDRETLSVMGHFGGRAAQKARRIKKANLRREMFARQVEANEHIVGIDGNDGPCPDGRIPF